MPLIKGHEHLGDLRLPDLVAKTAKVNLKDTIRVLIAARQVGMQFDMTLPEMIPEDYGFSKSPPTPQNVAACEQAYAEIEQHGERALLAIKTFR